jgi:thioredoxin-related protein
MKLSKLPSVMVVVLSLVLLGCPGHSSAANITWYSYDQGLAIAKEKHKKIYINFYADWCGYCKKMEKETFVDNDIARFLNENFIPVRLNSDKEQELSKKYSVRGLPTSLFLSETGETIGSQPGYMGPKDFMTVLKFVHEEKYKNGSK